MALAIQKEVGVRSRRGFLRCGAAVGSACLIEILRAGISFAAPKLDWQAVVDATHRELAQRQGYQSGDLISRGDAERVLKALEQMGWSVADRTKILERALDDGHSLVRELRTPAGLKFIRGVERQPHPYDRLDRLTNMPGGKQLIHDMILLPNGQKFMAPKPTPGFTDLTILLPKQANGKTPRDKDFDKPTGKIYTEADLLTALEQSWKSRKG